MPRRLQQKPKKFSIIIIVVLVVAICSAVLMSTDIKPTQTQVEQELDASTFLTQKQ